MNPSTMALQVRTANRDRKAEIEVDDTVQVGELLDAARSNWALSPDYEYIVRCERLQRQLRPTDSLAAAGIVAGDVIEILQISDAGSAARR